MRALTSGYDNSDKRKFKFGTPPEVWSTMLWCWDHEPTSARILADIEDFGNVLLMIVAFEGCVVPECRLRHGHRQQAHNGGRVLKRKVTSRQRKHLLRMGPVHDDAADALRLLLNFGPDEEELALEEVEDAEILEQENLDDIPDAEEEEEDDIPEDLPSHEEAEAPV